jgi:hypothetical protein
MRSGKTVTPAAPVPELPAIHIIVGRSYSCYWRAQLSGQLGEARPLDRITRRLRNTTASRSHALITTTAAGQVELKNLSGDNVLMFCATGTSN